MSLVPAFFASGRMNRNEGKERNGENVKRLHTNFIQHLKFSDSSGKELKIMSMYKYYKIIKYMLLNKFYLVELLKENFSALGDTVLAVFEDWLEI